jgi:Peptidase M15
LWQVFLFKRQQFYLLLISLVLMPACQGDGLGPFEAYQYRQWHQQYHSEVSAYQKYLKRHKVDRIVPMTQLLKSARHWQQCNAEPYSVPPAEIWSNIIPTLKAVKRLKKSGALKNPVAASVYRSPALNECAGGSKNSRHMLLSAIDFDIDASPTSLSKLCAQWRKLGPELKLGLGFYTPTRIHIDTMGFRTWGSDHSQNTSLCVAKT